MFAFIRQDAWVCAHVIVQRSLAEELARTDLTLEIIRALQVPPFVQFQVAVGLKALATRLANEITIL